MSKPLDAPPVRFWAKVRKTEACWIWTGGKNPDGYGIFFVGRINGRKVSCGAHRMVWEMTRGDIPEGMLVCHRCDNPGCVNPSHLFLGTHEDNMADMARKGRGNGPKGRSKKLTAPQVRDIRASSVGPYVIARRYGVAPHTIYMIRARKSWAHLE